MTVGASFYALTQEQRVARCVWELDKHDRGDERATETPRHWLDELAAALGIGLDGIVPNGSR